MLSYHVDKVKGVVGGQPRLLRSSSFSSFQQSNRTTRFSPSVQSYTRTNTPFSMVSTARHTLVISRTHPVLFYSLLTEKQSKFPVPIPLSLERVASSSTNSNLASSFTGSPPRTTSSEHQDRWCTIHIVQANLSSLTLSARLPFPPPSLTSTSSASPLPLSNPLPSSSESTARSSMVSFESSGTLSLYPSLILPLFWLSLASPSPFAPITEDFMLCKAEDRSPEHCLKEGRKVTRCAQDLYVSARSLLSPRYAGLAPCGGCRERGRFVRTGADHDESLLLRLLQHHQGPDDVLGRVQRTLGVPRA